jgi:hypothetical protein
MVFKFLGQEKMGHCDNPGPLSYLACDVGISSHSQKDRDKKGVRKDVEWNLIRLEY